MLSIILHSLLFSHLQRDNIEHTLLEEANLLLAACTIALRLATADTLYRRVAFSKSSSVILVRRETAHYRCLRCLLAAE